MRFSSFSGRTLLVSHIIAVYTAPMFHSFSQNDVVQVAEALLRWFEIHKRPLPWRQQYTPYEIWISEVMLQQTQMERGVSYFLRWMTRFPDVRSVAEAPEEEILRYWEGLGYYRRARFLHQAANIMLEQYDGTVPDSMEALSALPGIGEYTVAAILGIAYERNIVSVDANVERVFSRLLNVDSPVKKNPAASFIRKEARRLLPDGRARAYNQALMELGALICGKTPQCSLCPLSVWCVARKLGLERERPVSAAKTSIVPVSSVHGILICERNVLLLQRAPSGLWGNMWEFPGVLIKNETPEDALIQTMKNLGLPTEIIAPLGSVQHSYTNHKLTARFFRIDTVPHLSMKEISARLGDNIHRFVPWNKTEELAMPAHHRKMAERYFLRKHRIKAEQLPLQEGNHETHCLLD